jgi:hypothetical protein
VRSRSPSRRAEPRSTPPANLAGLPLRAIYTTGELSRAAGVDRRRLRRILDREGVELLTSGRISYVSLSELEVKIRPLWEGIKAAQSLRGLVDE